MDLYRTIKRANQGGWGLLLEMSLVATVGLTMLHIHAGPLPSLVALCLSASPLAWRQLHRPVFHVCRGSLVSHETFPDHPDAVEIAVSQAWTVRPEGTLVPYILRRRIQVSGDASWPALGCEVIVALQPEGLSFRLVTLLSDADLVDNGAVHSYLGR